MLKHYLFAIVLSSLLVFCKKDDPCNGCTPNNRAPVANAGIDQVIIPSVNFVNLDGSNSTDPDNNITNYYWTKISGPTSFNISDRTAPQTLVTILVPGIYLFELKVTDANSAYAFDTVKIEIQGPTILPLPPTADAGPDQTILLPTTRVTINGSNSKDPNFMPLNYKWKKIAGPDYVHYNSSFYNNPQPSQIEIELYGAGDYLFELIVTNSAGLSASDVVKITVTNSPPTAHPIDMTFSINPYCVISGNFPSPVYYGEAYFSLAAASFPGLSGGNSVAVARIEQAYEKYSTDYFSPSLLTLNEGFNLISFQFNPDINFFKLPYNRSSANFADSVFVTSGMGQFANIRHGTRLYCTGTADTTRRTGRIRLQGTIHY